MKKILLILGFVIFNIAYLTAQNVAINETGSAPNSNSMLDINADSNHDKGLLIPRLTTSQRTGISGLGTSDEGLTVYDTDTHSYWYWDGSSWVWMGQKRYWALTGNAGTTVGTNFLGTTDTISLSFKTNNIERMRILNTGEVGIGTTTPGYPLTVINGTAERVGSFISTDSSADNYGIYGECATSDYYGYGGYFVGGFVGVRALVTATGSGSYFGIYSSVSGGSGNNYGIYGKSDDNSGFGIYAKNTNTSGTGLIAIGNNVGGTYLTNGSAIAGTGNTTGVLGYAKDADGTGLVGTGDGETTITTLSGGSGISGNGTECGVYGHANSSTGSGVLGQNEDSDGWAGNFQGNTNLGISTSNVHNFWGYFQSGSANDDHRVLPNSGGYGYVGDGTYYWYYVVSENFANPSRRELKRNITPVNNIVSDVIMQDIEKMKPSLYKYKTETDNFEKGNEAKYRPNSHLGLILDEVPDYLQDNTFSGVDIYALSTLALTGVKYNRESIKKIQSKISDFGSENITGKEKFIKFSDEFASKITDNNIPVVTITSNNPQVTISIVGKTKKGFKVLTSDYVNNLSFDWIAMTKIDIKTTLTNEEINKIKKENNLIVSGEDKQKLKKFEANKNQHLETIKAKRKVKKNIKTKTVKLQIVNDFDINNKK